MALVPPGRAVSEARILDARAGLLLHEFPGMKVPDSVSDGMLHKMLGNTQHVRSAAAVWAVAMSLVAAKGGRSSSSSSTTSRAAPKTDIFALVAR